MEFRKVGFGESMTQEVRVTVVYTLSASTNFDADAIRNHVMRLADDGIGELVHDAGGAAILVQDRLGVINVMGSTVTDVQEEAEIYGNK
jgi:hypothetical protein